MSGRTLDGLLSLQDVAGEAPIGDPDEEGLGELRELGKGLTNYLFQSLRILAIHDRENAAVDEPLGRLSSVLGRLFGHTQTVHFITVEGQVYLNDLRIKMEASAYSNVQYLLGQLGRHGIGGITFVSALPPSDLKSLMLLLLETKPPKGEDADALQHIREALDAADIPDVEFDQPYYFKEGDKEYGGGGGMVEQGGQETAALSYAKGVLAVKDYFRAVEAAEAANPLRIRKIVHDLVDVSEDEPEDFLKLHVIHGVEDPYYNHCVNVATLAVAIGRVLGLTRVELADLGAAAMFHDVGYSAIERQEADEQREFSDGDRMRLHPVSGFKSLLKQGEYGPGLLRRLLVTLEHHMHFNRPGGYPNLGRKSLSVFSRIVAVADHYDALVTPTSDAPGLLPVKALERIVASAGTAFDPVVVKALVQVVGRYPYGSLVELSTGEVGVVTSGGREEEAFMRPIVMIVRAGDGSEVEPHAVDLAEKSILRRRVQAVLDPHDADLTPHAVLFDQLSSEDEEEEEPEAAAEPKVDPDAWNKAVWEGEDAESVVANTLSDSDAVPVVDEDRDGDGGFDERDTLEEEVPNLSQLAAAAEAEPTGAELAAQSMFLPPVDESWEGPAESVPELTPVAPPPVEEPAGGEQDDVLAWLDAQIGEAPPPEPPTEEPPADARDGAPEEASPEPDETAPDPDDAFPLPDDAFPLPDDPFPPPEDDDFGPPTVEVEPELPPAEQPLAPLPPLLDDDELDAPPVADDLPPLLPHDGEEEDDPEPLDDLPPLLPHDEPGEEEDLGGLSAEDQAWLAGLDAPEPAPKAAPAPEPAPKAAPAPEPAPKPAPAPEPEPAPEPASEPAKAVEPISKAELNALIQKAFAKGGEKAVQRLMDQLAAEGRT